MTVQQQLESNEVKLARIEERVKADRKSSAIFSQHISSELQEIKLMLKEHLAEEETQRLQFAFVVEKISNIEKTTNATSADLNSYKSKMKPWEYFQEFKRKPFYTFMAVYLIVSWVYIELIIKNIIKKYAE